MAPNTALAVCAAPVVVERHAFAMGSNVHIVLTGHDDDSDRAAELERLADEALDLIDSLEGRWSRFLPTSDVSRINRLAPHDVIVGSDTLEVVQLAVDAGRRTGGMFDATRLGDLIAAGYGQSRTASGAHEPEAMQCEVSGVRERARDRRHRAQGPRVDHNRLTVAVPVGAGLDLGGIGKGRAADLALSLLGRRGATGACVNLGGDLHLRGQSPDGDGWVVAIDHPFSSAEPVGTLVFGGPGGPSLPHDGMAVATSSTMRRRWSCPSGEIAHHLIDPRTGRPSLTDLVQVTVVAPSTVEAEVAAKVLMLLGRQGLADLPRVDHILGASAGALVVSADGAVFRLGQLELWEWKA